MAAAPTIPSSHRLLKESASIQRLCVNYGGQRQRIGIALMVAAVSLGSFLLGHDSAIADDIVSHAVVGAAVAAIVALAVLAVLFTRDTRDLRDRQGARLLRALQVDRSVSAEVVAEISARGASTRIFFECYALWCTSAPPYHDHGPAAEAPAA